MRIAIALILAASVAKAATPAKPPPAPAAPAPAPAKPAPEPVKPATPDPAIVAPPVPAAPGETTILPYFPPKGFVALGAQALIPQPFSRFAFAPGVELSGGWFTPALGSKLAIVGSIGFASLAHERTASDPRVAGGSYSYTVTERDLRVGLGARYHFANADESISPFAGAGLRVHFLGGTSSGTAGASAFGDASEKGTVIGGAIGGGATFGLGPGRLSAALDVDLAPMEHTITGKTALSAVGVTVGYGLLFGGS